MNQYRLHDTLEPYAKLIKNVSGVFRKHKKTVPKYPYCTANDFDTLIHRAGPNTSSPEGIFDTGHYARDILRWHSAIPSEQILVLFHEDFVKDAVGEIDRVQQFLGLPWYNYSAITTTIDGYTVLRGGVSKATSSSSHYSPMSTYAETLLDQYYRESNAKLMRLLDRRTTPDGWPK